MTNDLNVFPCRRGCVLVQIPNLSNQPNTGNEFMPAPIKTFEVFFDGQCPLCKREIEMIRRQDKSKKLELTDISRSDFSSDDFSLDTLMREIHGRMPNGEYVKGVEVFREIYQRIGFSGIVASTRLPVIRQLLDVAYRCFAFLRFKHAMHRLKKSEVENSANSCETGSCQPFKSSSETIR